MHFYGQFPSMWRHHHSRREIWTFVGRHISKYVQHLHKNKYLYTFTSVKYGVGMYVSMWLGQIGDAYSNTHAEDSDRWKQEDTRGSGAYVVTCNISFMEWGCLVYRVVGPNQQTSGEIRKQEDTRRSRANGMTSHYYGAGDVLQLTWLGQINKCMVKHASKKTQTDGN